MKYYTPLFAGILIGAISFAVFTPPTVLGAPSSQATFQKNLIPLTDSAFTLGTTSKAWLNVYADQICLAGDCQVAWPGGASLWTDATTYLYPTGGRYLSFPYLVSTSTATSTFAGGVSLGLNNHLVAHGAVADGSDGFHIDSYNGTMSANFGAGGGANATFYDGVTVTGVLSANGNFTTPFGTSTTFYAGTSTLTNATSSTFFSALGTFTNSVINTLLTAVSGVFTSSLQIPNSSDPTVDASGEIAVNTSTSSLRFHDNTAERQIKSEWSWGATFASSSLAYDGAFGTTGTTTVKRSGFKYGVTHSEYYCRTNSGEVTIVVGDGTASSSPVRCTTSGTADSTASNGAFTSREMILIAVGSANGTTTSDIYFDATARWTTD